MWVDIAVMHMQHKSGKEHMDAALACAAQFSFIGGLNEP